MQSKKQLALLPAVLAVLTAALVLGTIILLPYDAPEQEPANSPVNLMNGGGFATESGLIYFIDANGGLVCRTPTGISYQLADGGCSDINPRGDKVVYLQNGAVMQNDFMGGEERVLVERADQMLVSGNWVYYTDPDGMLCKSKIGSGKSRPLGIRPAGQFTVSGAALFYVGEGGSFCRAKTDGREAERLFDGPVDRFMIQDSYLFCLSEGSACILSMSEPSAKTALAEADEFVLDGATLIYTKDGGLFTLNYTQADAEPVAVDSGVGPVKGLCLCGGLLYFRDEAGVPYSMRSDGSERKAL